MKLVTILIIVTAVAIAALAFLGKQMGMDIIKLEAPSLPSISSMSDVESTVTGTTTVQKWQDANGQWHFGNAAPVGANAQEMQIRTDQNIVQHYQAPKAAATDQTMADDANLGMEEELGMSGALPSQMLLKMKQQSAEQALKDQLQ